jgi:hypothetical protein
MKRFVSGALFATCLLAASSVVGAQDCSNWANWDLRGSYTLSGSGYIDLSKTFPGAGLPSGMSPFNWVGGHALNGAGGETTPGWVVFNMGGYQINAQYVDYTYSMKANCSVLVTFRLKLTDLGVTTGVQTSLKVVVPKPGELQLDSITLGTALGTPAASSLGVEVMHRISMQF